MAKSSNLPRRLLVGGVLLLPAAPALAQAPAKKKAAEPAIPATERLMREHGVIDRVLLIYEAGIRRLGQDEDLEPAVFIQTGEIMRDFVHDYHERSKEEYVFPRFKKAGRMVELVDVLQAQQAAGRKLTERVLKAAEPARASKDQRSAMTEAMKASIVLYRPHMAREDTDIFPTLRSLVTSSEFEEISETLAKRESEMFGADGFEKVAKRVEALEKKIGTHDLTQYTPKS
jgi:hemerythrin-like domain-containing protein